MPEQLRNAMVHSLDVVDRYHATLPQEVIAAAIDMGSRSTGTTFRSWTRFRSPPPRCDARCASVTRSPSPSPPAPPVHPRNDGWQALRVIKAMRRSRRAQARGSMRRRGDIAVVRWTRGVCRVGSAHPFLGIRARDGGQSPPIPAAAIPAPPSRSRRASCQRSTPAVHRRRAWLSLNVNKTKVICKYVSFCVTEAICC